MRIVTVAALHEPFVDAVMKRPVELLFCFKVTAVAELRLFFLHQKLIFFRVVRVVAIRAAHVVLQMRRSSEIAVFFAVLMTGQTAVADLFRRSVLERENLSLVSPAVDMCFPWSMAGFASVPFRTFLRIHRRGVVGGKIRSS